MRSPDSMSSSTPSPDNNVTATAKPDEGRVSAFLRQRGRLALALSGALMLSTCAQTSATKTPYETEMVEKAAEEPRTPEMSPEEQKLMEQAKEIVELAQEKQLKDISQLTESPDFDKLLLLVAEELSQNDLGKFFHNFHYLRKKLSPSDFDRLLVQAAESLVKNDQRLFFRKFPFFSKHPRGKEWLDTASENAIENDPGAFIAYYSEHFSKHPKGKEWLGIAGENAAKIDPISFLGYYSKYFSKHPKGKEWLDMAGENATKIDPISFLGHLEHHEERFSNHPKKEEWMGIAGKNAARDKSSHMGLFFQFYLFDNHPDRDEIIELANKADPDLNMQPVPSELANLITTHRKRTDFAASWETVVRDFTRGYMLPEVRGPLLLRDDGGAAYNASGRRQLNRLLSRVSRSPRLMELAYSNALPAIKTGFSAMERDEQVYLLERIKHASHYAHRFDYKNEATYLRKCKRRARLKSLNACYRECKYHPDDPSCYRECRNDDELFMYNDNGRYNDGFADIGPDGHKEYREDEAYIFRRVRDGVSIKTIAKYAAKLYEDLEPLVK